MKMHKEKNENLFSVLKYAIEKIFYKCIVHHFSQMLHFSTQVNLTLMLLHKNIQHHVRLFLIRNYFKTVSVDNFSGLVIVARSFTFDIHMWILYFTKLYLIKLKKKRKKNLHEIECLFLVLEFLFMSRIY